MFHKRMIHCMGLWVVVVRRMDYGSQHGPLKRPCYWEQQQHQLLLGP